jgi:hypothetical protein
VEAPAFIISQMALASRVAAASTVARHLSSDNAPTVKHIYQNPQQKEKNDVSRALSYKRPLFTGD